MIEVFNPDRKLQFKLFILSNSAYLLIIKALIRLINNKHVNKQNMNGDKNEYHLHTVYIGTLVNVCS